MYFLRFGNYAELYEVPQRKFLLRQNSTFEIICKYNNIKSNTEKLEIGHIKKEEK